MGTDNINYYDVLKSSRSSTKEEIKKQYRILVKKCRLDRLVGLLHKYQESNDDVLVSVIKEKIERATEEAKILNEAYEILSDPDKRRQYDEELNLSDTSDKEININKTKQPEIVVSVKNLDFGEMVKGSVQTKSFLVKNEGGVASEVNFDWVSNESWANFKLDISDPITGFPINVKVTVDSNAANPGLNRNTITVIADGKKWGEVMVEMIVLVPVVDPVKPIKPDPVVKPTPAGTRKSSATTVPLWNWIWVSFAILIGIGVIFFITNLAITLINSAVVNKPSLNYSTVPIVTQVPTQAQVDLLKNFKIVEIGTYADRGFLRKALEESGVQIGAGTDYIINKTELSTFKQSLDLVVLSVKELGFQRGAYPKDIYEAAKNLGLDLCPAEVGPQLRLQYLDQPNGDRLMIAMEPISSYYGELVLFGVGCGVYYNGRWLDIFVGPASYFDAADRFVFVRRK